MRLGVWARIGIVVSVLWMLVATVAMTSNELADWRTRTASMQELCLRVSDKLPPSMVSAAYTKCEQDSRSSTNAMIEARWPLLKGSAGLSAVALILAWLLFGVIYGTVRWILNGRRNIRKPD